MKLGVLVSIVVGVLVLVTGCAATPPGAPPRATPVKHAVVFEVAGSRAASVTYTIDANDTARRVRVHPLWQSDPLFVTGPTVVAMSAQNLDDRSGSFVECRIRVDRVLVSREYSNDPYGMASCSWPIREN